MKTRIKLHTVRQIIKSGQVTVAGGVVVTLDDGKNLHFDITTLTNGKPVAALGTMQINGKTIVKQANPKHPITMAAISAFIRFVELTRCLTFSDGKFDGSDRFLRNNTVKPSQFFSSLTDYECVIDGQFVRVTGYQYEAMPLDMSEGWQSFEPSDQQRAMIDQLTAPVKRALRQQSEYATRRYTKSANGGYRQKSIA